MDRPARFYSPLSLKGDSIVLDETESHHAVKVRRLGPRSRVEIFDGAGSSRRGVLERSTRGRVCVSFDTPLQTDERPDRTVTILVSPARGDRMTFAVEKLSELGCDTIVPVVFSRSLDAGVRAATGRTAKWRRKAIESAKQCGRNRIVDIAEPVPIERALAEQRSAATRFLLDIDDIDENARETPFLGDALAKSALTGETAIIVGPEGGFTDDERGAIISWGAERVRLWENVLRIETAALAAAALYQDARRLDDSPSADRD